MRALWLWGYLVRVEQPVARSLGGQRPYLYTLGRRAVPVVQARRAADWHPVRVRRLERLDPDNVEHDLQAAALWANLTAVLRGSRVRRFRWIPERELRARKLRVPDPDSRHWLPFLPDGLYEVTYPVWEPRPTLVETDTGSLTLERFRRKVRAWEAYLDTGRFRRAFKRDSFEVVVLARSEKRMQHLWAEARAHVPDDRWWAYRFATWDALGPAKFGGACWVDLERSWSPLLDSRAFTAPADPCEEYAVSGADDGEDDDIDEEEDRPDDISPRHWRDETDDEDKEDVA